MSQQAIPCCQSWPFAYGCVLVITLNYYHKTLPHATHTPTEASRPNHWTKFPSCPCPCAFKGLFTSRKVSIEFDLKGLNMRPGTLLWHWSNSTQVHSYTTCVFKNRPGLYNFFFFGGAGHSENRIGKGTESESFIPRGGNPHTKHGSA